jgi:hypothetical protein
VNTNGDSIVNGTSFAPNDVSFSVSYIKFIPTLQATNHTGDELTVSFQARSWTSILSSSLICRAILKPLTGSIFVQTNIS